MANLIYRVVSVSGALGYGYPEESLDTACEGQLDAVISDAGSMDAGPYFLGTGTCYFEREAVKRDFRLMVRAATVKDCPLILGSCGMAGADANLDWMLAIAKEVFAELGVADAKVAVIPSQVDNRLILAEFRSGHLKPLGAMAPVSEEDIEKSVIVGQMGIHPIVTALEAGAMVVLCGRSCDIALFASDMVRRGIDPGIAYHVGHVLECGALACDPGSPSDCLVAEVYDDGTAHFVAPNRWRKCTPYSIAAHSLYEESHPQLQFYPEGVLTMEHTEFFAVSPAVAGIRNSVFAHSSPMTLKLEGSRWMGRRKVSVLYCAAESLPKIPEDYFVYGRNGVERSPVSTAGEKEIGIIIETRAAKPEAATFLASLLTHYMIHYGYPGRKSTAGNIAYPLSPNLVNFRHADGSCGTVVLSGTRDPVFQENWEQIRQAVLDSIAEEFPSALQQASYTITIAGSDRPAIVIVTVDEDEVQVVRKHDLALKGLRELVVPLPGSLTGLDAADSYCWTLYHLLTNEAVIQQELFPVRLYAAAGADWVLQQELRPRYFDIGVKYAGNLDARTLSVITDMPPTGAKMGEARLRDMAVVIRSKDAGVDTLTFDIIFRDAQRYAAALRSNVFCKEKIAPVLHTEVDQVVGCYRVDSCNAIRISVNHPIISASLSERDVFGAQQEAELIMMTVPLFGTDRVSYAA